MLELITAWESHADYLEQRGDKRQADRFRKAAAALELQIGVPPAGQGNPKDMSRIQAARTAGAPEEITPVAPEVAPPESGGFTPVQLRKSVGRGSLRRI
jgi:hypothetical protein